MPAGNKNKSTLPDEINAYHSELSDPDRAIGERLASLIDAELPDAERKIWHRHPVWFLNGNPIVGYSKLKDSMRLLFWSGQSFEEEGLQPEGSFRAAEARYQSIDQLDENLLRRWLQKARHIQWDYKNLVRRKGQLLPLF